MIVGVMAGLASGLVGIGGGIVVIPALVVFFGFSQKLAQGTTLALMIPPIGILGALVYYKQGFVDIRAAGLIIVGFLFGSIFGAKLATRLPEVAVSRIFAVFLILVAVKMLWDSAK